MTDENDVTMWPPMFKGMQEASEQALESQQEMMQQMFSSVIGYYHLHLSTT